MGTRPLSPDEAALWARVMAGVRPLRAVVSAGSTAFSSPPLKERGKGWSSVYGGSKPPEALRSSAEAFLSAQTRAPTPNPSPKGEGLKTAKSPSNTLDGTWDRQLSRGLVAPDRTIDLHGHTLHSAHDLLDAALDAAIRNGNRMILLITGKPPRPTSERPHARGAIRAATGDWLAGSRHAASIAAVRPAHPRHGGGGSLYIVLRKPRAQTALSRKS